MKPGKRLLAVITVIIAAFICVAVFGIGDGIKGVSEMRFGIDIRGGVEAIFEPEGIDRKATEQELKTVREVIEMRLDAENITDREVTIDKQAGYIIVRFPWKSTETEFNPEEAIAELGDMAQLTFQDESGNVLLEGKNVKNSSVEKIENNGIMQYVVQLEFDDESAILFEEITGNLLGKHLGIYMDGRQISNPVVESKIPGGWATISGMEDYAEAKDFSDKINAGALPFSLGTTSFSTISPTLGNNALQIMIIASIIALLLVSIFMLVFYKLPGAVACITLFFQMVLQLLAVSIPQFTLTLPGIAGIILSLGMAVDANIIISERISEELKQGKTIRTAILNGYKNGFTSVLDGNITTAIVAIILMIFGSGSMLSFGYTLLAGMIINVFVGVTVSKQILLSLQFIPVWKNEKWYRIKKNIRVKKLYEKKYICAIISGIIFVIGISGILVKGVKLDTQFTGGTVLEYQISGEHDLNTIKSKIEQITNRAVTVQETNSRMTDSNNLEITLAENSGISPEQQQEITGILEKVAGKENILLAQTYSIEPYIGEKTLKNAGIAIVLSFVFIVLYVWIRFSALPGLSAGVMALVALFHDVLVCFFTFVIAGIPLNDAFVAVILTIIGYSINDTIVVYDRIRENRNISSDQDVRELTNTSVSQVMARSVNTSITTAVCVLTILIASIFFKIDSIFDFAFPMFFGLISGCYSSVCIASVLWAMWEKRKEAKVKES